MSSMKCFVKKLTPLVRDIPVTELAKESTPFAHACLSENTVYSFLLRASSVCKKACKILGSRTGQIAQS